MFPHEESRTNPRRSNSKLVKSSSQKAESKWVPDLEVNEFFQDCCSPMFPKGYKYLNQIGIYDELIACYQVGFLKDSKHTFKLLVNSFGWKRLNLAGFLKEDSGFVFDNNQIIFPFFVKQTPMFFQAKSIHKPLPKETGLSTPNRWIYNSDVLSYLKVGATVYVTKSPIDTLIMIEESLSFEVIPDFAFVGIEDFGPEHSKQLEQYRVVRS